MINCNLRTPFSDADRKVIERHFNLADAVARLIGSHCEVVLHSLERPDRSVVKIVNGHISGRSVGAPLTNLCFDILRNADTSQSDIIGPYYSLGKNGATTRSVTCIIRGAEGHPIGLICFNMDLSCSFDGMIREYAFRPDRVDVDISEIYPQTVEELINHMLTGAIASANEMKGVSPQEKNIATVQMLMDKGVFNFKGAVDIVAHELGISRTSVYNYMRDPRGLSIELP